MKNYDDFNKKSVEGLYGNLNKLQKEVSDKQKSFVKDYFIDLKKYQGDYNIATTNSQRAIAQKAIDNLNQQKAAFEGVDKSLKELAKTEKEKSDKVWNFFTFGLSGVLSDIKKGFAGGGISGLIGGGSAILSAIKPVVDYLIDVLFMNDKMQTDIAKNLGVSKGESVGILDAYRGIAANSGQTLTFAKDLIEANAQISSQYSMMVPITGNILTNQTFMTKELGLQADEASRLNSIFLLNGNQGREGLNIVYKQVAEYANQNKILFSGKAILSEISKVSGQIRASFKGSTEEMAKSVIEATRLGTTLSQTRSMSESLLNFETSIDNELKAELLTGQQLNLEKARALALSGKYVDAGKEMLEQAGGLDNFQKLNVIQQKALSEAVGLTGDQLADVLFKQSETGKYAEDLADKYEAIGDFAMAQRIRKGELDAQGLKAAEATLSSQQKFEASMERVKEIFANFVNSGLLDKLASFAEAFTKRLASGSLAHAIFHDYSEDMLGIKKDKIATSFENKEISKEEYAKQNKLADIEFKRQQELEKNNSFINSIFRNEEERRIKDKNPNLSDSQVTEVRNKEINQKYDALIAAIEKMTKTPIRAEISSSSVTKLVKDTY
jgi:hypothetical protein